MYTDRGKENSWFVPLKGIKDPGSRETTYLDYIDTQSSGPGAPGNLEAGAYLPDVFFAHNMGATGWISFSLLSQTLQGLMGVQPNAAAQSLTITSQLPSDIGWLQLSSIPVGSTTVTLRRDGTTYTSATVTVSAGQTTVIQVTGRSPRPTAGPPTAAVPPCSHIRRSGTACPTSAVPGLPGWRPPSRTPGAATGPGGQARSTVVWDDGDRDGMTVQNAVSEVRAATNSNARASSQCPLGALNAGDEQPRCDRERRRDPP